MKLFTGIESFEIMAIPFFILAGNFLTHGGVARRMIDFATSLVGHWHGGLGACRHRRLRDVRAGMRLERRDRGGDRRRSCCPRWSGTAIRCASAPASSPSRLARHPDAAVDPEGRLRGLDQHLDRRAVRRRPAARHAADRHAVHRHLVSRQRAQLSAHDEGELERRPCARSARASGA